MFSGIIESLGTIREFVHSQESAAMVVETKTNFSRLEKGESIAVNGVCLTSPLSISMSPCCEWIWGRRH